MNQLQFALKALLIQSLYGVNIHVMNTKFSGLSNITVLYYYRESSGTSTWSRSRLTFQHCLIYKNTNSLNPLLHIVVHNVRTFNHKVNNTDNKHTNVVTLIHCKFSDNFNTASLLQIVPVNTASLNVHIQIISCRFSKNTASVIIEIRSRVNIFWQMSHQISLDNTTIDYNIHKRGICLLFSVNGVLNLLNSVVINNNTYYNSLIELHLSILSIHGNCKIFGNIVKYISKRNQDSYFLFQEHSVLSITDNTVFTPLSTKVINNSEREEHVICYFQFGSHKGNFDNAMKQKAIALNYTIIFSYNILIDPLCNTKCIQLIDNDCTWLTDAAFMTSTSTDVSNRIISSKMNERKVYKLLCYCVETNYDCTIDTLGLVYMGQTLKVNFIILPGFLSTFSSPTVTIQVVDNIDLSNSCKIVYLHEISQTYSSHGCNEYSYTIWSNRSSPHYCKLYLRFAQTIEVFHVNLLPCLVGFTSLTLENGCHCDPVLQNNLIFVKSCDINDQTIQQPGNAWVIATVHSNQVIYSVSLNCPFDYCLPYSSHINFLYPDTQCQYNRTGVLCGECPVGLSSVFGSSQCKHCSNIYLLIVLPLAVSGFILVILLFIFNLTITKSNISTVIFYVNIIGINNLVFFPEHRSLVYVFLAFLNINFGIETYFYNNMNGYDKSWLQLVFPSYLLALVILLVMASRYSIRIQRMTARRALPVLATLLLLCYTNILQGVCITLFFYSKVTYLPSKNSTLVWSVATDTHLFKFKFVLLFTTCLIILLMILLPFNIVLLFSRKLSYFKVINYFKPLIDVYHGPYKDNFFYWTGLQLLIRMIIFGLSVLDNKITFLSISVLLAVFFCIHSMANPYKSKFKNIQEAFVLLNLLAVHVTAFYNSTFGE